MAYQIAYHLMEMKKTKPKKDMPLLGKGILLGMGWVAGYFLMILFQTVLGGQWQQTVDVLEKMVQILRQGSSMQDAVAVFCQELIA